MSDCCSGGPSKAPVKPVSVTLTGFGLVLEIDRGQRQLRALLERGDQLVGQRRLGDAAVGEAEHVVELLRLAAVDLQADAGRHQAAGRHRDLEHLAVHLALELDQADAGDELAGAGADDVLHVADVDVFLLGAGLEPALRNLLLLLGGRRHGGRRPDSPTTPAAMTDSAVNSVLRLVMLSVSSRIVRKRRCAAAFACYLLRN